eukprot:284815055_2
MLYAERTAVDTPFAFNRILRIIRSCIEHVRKFELLQRYKKAVVMTTDSKPLASAAWPAFGLLFLNNKILNHNTATDLWVMQWTFLEKLNHLILHSLLQLVNCLAVLGQQSLQSYTRIKQCSPNVTAMTYTFGLMGLPKAKYAVPISIHGDLSGNKVWVLRTVIRKPTVSEETRFFAYHMARSRSCFRLKNEKNRPRAVDGRSWSVFPPETQPARYSSSAIPCSDASSVRQTRQLPILLWSFLSPEALATNVLPFAL